jgi:hypothetical protein
MFWGVVQSCNRPTREEILKDEIKTNEATIEAIQAKRDSANADTVPFSDSKRTKVVESVNDKTGFDLSVRPQKAN